MNTFKVTLLAVGILLTYSISYSQKNDEKLKTFKSDSLGIEFKYPETWENGKSLTPIIHWVVVPPFKSLGNIVLKVVQWKEKPDIKRYSSENYKKDILSTSFYFKNLNFIEFSNRISISGVDGIYAYYKADGILKDKFYYEVLIQWWHENLLYTIQGQFEAPELRENELRQIKNLMNSIKIYKK